MTLQIIIVTLLFVLFDLGTGFLGAIVQKNLNSSKLRTGMFHKGAFILAIILAGLIDYTQTIIDIGFLIPILKPVCLYIIVTEIISGFENMCILNPKLKSSKLANYFEKVGDTNDNN